MAAIVKANPSLTAGGLAVLRRQYSTTDDGTLNYEAEYVCISQFANNHIGRFRTGAQPPTPIPASMSQLSLESAPKLYDFSTSTQNGLTYFSARYSAAVRGLAEVTITQSQETRNFSATFENGEGAIYTSTGNVSQIVVGPFTASFDYESTTITCESKSEQSLPDLKGSVGNIRNVSISTIRGTKVNLNGRTYWKPQTVESLSSSKSSRGNYTFRKSSSGVYVQADGFGPKLQLSTARIFDGTATNIIPMERSGVFVGY